MMTPRSPSIASSLPISAATRRIMLKEPIRLTRITFSKSASGWAPSRPATRLATPIPAQLTETHAGPCAAAALAIGRAGGRFVGDVADNRRAADRLGRLLRRRRVEVEDRDPRSLGGKRLRRRAASPEGPPVTIAAAPDSFIALPPLARTSRARPHINGRQSAPLVRRRRAERRGTCVAVAELHENPAAFDLRRIRREIDAGRRALRFAGGEIEPAVVHWAFDDRARNEPVGEFDPVHACAGRRWRNSGRPLCGRARIAAFVFEWRDVLGRDAVAGPASIQVSLISDGLRRLRR